MLPSSSYTPLSSNDNVPLQNLHSKHLATIRPPEGSFASPGNWTFLTRWVAFVIMEAGFLLLGAYTLSHPIPLYLPSFLEAQAKGIFTVLIVGWQSLCIQFLITPIVQLIFSSEWHFQLQKSESVLPGKTDIVSTLTSGIIDQFQHLCSSDASKTFRIAFVLYLALLSLGGISPGAIGIATVPLTRKIQMQIANMSIVTFDWDIDTIDFDQYLHRSAIITHIEQIEGTNYKYTVQPNQIIPVPVGMGIPEGPIKYWSDYWKFNLSCTWKAPATDEYMNLYVDEGVWSIYNAERPQAADGKQGFWTNGVFSLYPMNASITIPKSAYLFAGRNSTFQSNNTGGINLDNIPSTPTVDVSNNSYPDAFPIASSLISILLCDPGLEFSVGEVTLNANGSLTVLESLTHAPIGNFPVDAANNIAGGALMYSPIYTLGGVRLLFTLGIDVWYLNDIMARLFTQNLPLKEGSTDAPLVPLLSLDQINKNINTCFLSASKGFTDGYGYPVDERGDLIVTLTQALLYNNITTEGTIALQNPAIQASKLVYSITCAIVGLVAISTPILYKGWKRGKAYPFSFESLHKAQILKDK